MIELIEAGWPLFLLALAIGIAIAWLVFRGSRRTRVEVDRRDALDEDAAPTRRNEALIAAPPAAEPAPPRVDPVPSPVPEAPAPVAAPLPPQPSIAATRTVEPASAPAAEATVAPGGDDLTRLKGVGPKLVAALNERGVTRFEQIAAWDEAEIERVDATLGRFQGRIRRDDWVGQARLLAEGDEAGYAERFGNF